jgi:hypothetical protein
MKYFCRVQHSYENTGLYTVRASYPRPVTRETIRAVTMVSVQERIRDLVIKGPTHVPNVRYHIGTNHSIASQYTWEATTSRGSDLVYNWTVSGPGVHKSEIAAQNKVSPF